MSTVAKEVQVIKATKTGEKAEKIRVAAYCRVSTDKDDQLNSFFAQMRYYTDFVRSNDKMVLVDIYADEGITGTELEKRDEMKRLIRDCKHKKIDRVLVKSVTRFARNSLECTKEQDIDNKIESDYLEKAVSKIVVDADGTITIRFINGSEIKDREENNAGTSEKNRNKNRRQSVTCKAK